MSLPQIKIELEDGNTPGTWYDITAYFDRTASLSISRGREDEFTQIEASTLSLTLVNDDGRFTLGRSGGPYNLRLRQSIRVRVYDPTFGVWIPRFTGYVNSWPMRWTSGVAKGSRVVVSAADALARLTKPKLVGPAYIGEALSDRPTALYRLDEPAGAGIASDATGNSGLPLSPAGAGTPPIFGTPLGDLSGSADFAAGQSLWSGRWQTPSGLRAVECVFATSTTVQGTLAHVITGTGEAQLYVTAAGNVAVRLTGSIGSGTIVSPGSYADGLPHHVIATATSYPTWTLFVDGVSVGTHNPGTITPSIWDMRVGDGLVGQVAAVALYPTALTATRAIDHATGFTTRWAGERSDQRIDRIYRHARLTSGITAETGEQEVTGMGDLTGTSPIDAMRTIAEAEQGVVFVDGSGVLRFHARGHRYTATPAATIASSLIDPATEFTGDDQGLINRATVTRDDETGSPQVVADQTSIDPYDESAYEATLPIPSDEDAMQIASWLVGTYAQPMARTPSLKLDLLTRPDSFATGILGIEIGDKLVITGLPSQAPASTLELFVEGWTETISADEWSIAANTSPAAPYNVWTIGDPVYGAYDSNPLAL